LEVFEVVGGGEIEGAEVFGEDDDGVADEEMGEVGGQEGVHAAGDEFGVEGGVGEEGGVVVFGAEAGVLGDVGGVGGVAGFGDAPAVGGEGLCGCGLATVVSIRARLILLPFCPILHLFGHQQPD